MKTIEKTWISSAGLEVGTPVNVEEYVEQNYKHVYEPFEVNVATEVSGREEMKLIYEYITSFGTVENLPISLMNILLNHEFSRNELAPMRKELEGGNRL
ncbi:hypothetical protein [Paraliobacillus salinarum]|uniref:hypothetical protein n=1 Tax=Paraliobacillus salinarum TaxID=1158996 RepID=UPI0015F3DC01|nr:hypothetical protein [Paraliobacillus salinarum]